MKVTVVSPKNWNIDFYFFLRKKTSNLINKNMCGHNQYFLFMPPHKLFLLIEKSIELELSNPVCVWERESVREPKGRASGSEIDPEILPYLTGAINSSIMMLTIAQVTRRTRRGQAACSGSPFSHVSAECGTHCQTSPRVKKVGGEKKNSSASASPVIKVSLHTVCLVSFNQEHFVYIMIGSFHKFIFIWSPL